MGRRGGWRLLLHVLEHLLGGVLGQGRRRRVLRGQLEVHSHLVSPELLLIDKHHIALLARLQALVDGLDVVKQMVPTLERLVTALAVENTLTVDSLQTLECVKLK